jgi:hypothetical protein
MIVQVWVVLRLQLEKDPTVWQRFSTKDAYMRTLTSSGLMYEVCACPLQGCSRCWSTCASLAHERAPRGF